VSIGDGQTRSRLVLLKPNLKEFHSACIKKFTIYIWSIAMKRNFSKHLEFIVEKIGVLLLSSRIVDQMFFLKNDHFLFEKLDKFIFHKNVEDFFRLFPGRSFENTLLVDDTPPKGMFNPCFNVIFFDTFCGSNTNNNYLFEMVFPYLESLYSSRM
jgi:hypothetical protein